ncbi:hypothetical protein CLAIMM_03325 [Cladophialophora immunda]|nr:hypothetical protein CLAIMM_03325 [Cladophialophora immunda]
MESSNLLPHLQQLTIRNKDGPSKPGPQSHSTPTQRLHVGIDFGTTTSSICYDEVAGITSLSERALAQNVICEPSDVSSHRIPSVAFVYGDITSNGNTYLVLKLGEFPGDSLSSRLLTKIELMKMALLPTYHETPRDPLSASMLQSLKAQHEDAIRKIQFETMSNQMYTQDPLTGQFEPCTVNSMHDLITLFFNFLWRLTMKHCATTHNMTVENVVNLFQANVHVAVSAPALVQEDYERADRLHDSMLNTYCLLLARAGYPRSTSLLFEAKSAALFHIITNIQRTHTSMTQTQQLHATTVVDIGGGTTDICCLRPDNIDDATVMFGDNFGASTMDGSLKINEVFKELLRTQLPGSVLQLAPEFNGSESDFLEALATQFEREKRTADSHARRCELRVPCRRKPLLYADFFVNGHFFLNPGTMQKIFDNWLQNIFHQVEKEMRDHGLFQPSASIGLTGWGSRPPYILAAFERRYHEKGINVYMVGDFINHPAVAQGNFLALTAQRGALRRVARTTFVTHDDLTSCFGRTHVRNTTNLIDKDDNLNDPAKVFPKTGAFVMENPVFPLSLNIAIKDDTGFGSIEAEGEMKVKLESLGRCGFRLETGSNGATVLKFQYSVQICWQGPMTLVVLTVPHTGQMDNPNRNRDLDLVVSLPVNIQKHAARMG